MHEAPHPQDIGQHPTGPQGGQEEWEQPTPGLLSQSDPEPGRTTGRPPIWLIMIVALLIAAVIVLHLSGAVGPGSH